MKSVIFAVVLGFAAMFGTEANATDNFRIVRDSHGRSFVVRDFSRSRSVRSFRDVRDFGVRRSREVNIVRNRGFGGCLNRGRSIQRSRTVFRF